jgi:hypothetical protein
VPILVLGTEGALAIVTAYRGYSCPRLVAQTVGSMEELRMGLGPWARLRC